jgi:hypothetical protein
MMTKKSSSNVRIGCSTDRRPTWSANDWNRKPEITNRNPRSHTPRRRAWATRLSFMVADSGASSTPMR